MIYSVIVDVSASEVDKIFDYKGEGYSVGSRVLVDFHFRKVEGFIVGEKQTTDCPPSKLKSIICALDDFVAISPTALELCNYMRQEYLGCGYKT